MRPRPTCAPPHAPRPTQVFQGKTVKVPVCTGPDGVAEFKRTVCKLFNLPEGTDFEVSFECKSPVFGEWGSVGWWCWWASCGCCCC